MPDIRHNLTLLQGHGFWAICTCGWESLAYDRKLGAELAFGNHLVEARLLDHVDA